MPSDLTYQCRFCAACFDDRQGLTLTDGVVLCRECVGYRKDDLEVVRLLDWVDVDVGPCARPDQCEDGRPCDPCNVRNLTAMVRTFLKGRRGFDS